MKRILWYIPLLLLIHNTEEVLTMPQWVSVHMDMLRMNYSFFENFQFSSKQIYISLVLISLISVTISYYCISGELTERSVMTLMILQSIIFWNALVPHVAGSVLLKMYNPGVLTALVCNIPFSFYLATQVLKKGIVRPARLRTAVIAGLLLYLPAVYLNHLLAHALALFL